MFYHNLCAAIALAVASVVVVAQSLNQASRPRRGDRWEQEGEDPTTVKPSKTRRLVPVLATFGDSQESANSAQVGVADAIPPADRENVAKVGEPARRSAAANHNIPAQSALGMVHAGPLSIGVTINPTSREARMRIISPVLVAVFLLTVVSACGKLTSPTRRDTMPARPNTPNIVRKDGDPLDPQYFAWKDRFVGDSDNLAYGYGDPSVILTQARAMASVAAIMPLAQARGYIRRSDTDCAFTSDGTRVGYSMVALGFEKPGFAVTDRQPVAFVITQAFEIPNVGWRAVTQVFLGVGRDSAGQVVPVDTPEDSVIFVSATSSGGSAYDKLQFLTMFTPPDSPTVTDTDSPPFTNFRDPGMMWNNFQGGGVSQGMQAMYDACMSETLQGAALGAAGGGVTGFTGGPTSGYTGLLVGAIIGAYQAFHSFWYQRPDTSRAGGH